MSKLLVLAAMLLTSVAANALPAVWEADFGNAIVSGDDNTVDGSFDFAFPFLGGSYTSFNASTNGFVSLGGNNGNGCCNGDVGNLLNGAPRVAAQWFDIIGTVFVNTAVTGRAVFTWTGTEFGTGGSYTTQAQLFDTGRIIFGFDGPDVVPGHVTLTGVSAGNGAADPGSTDLGAGGFSTGSGQSFYQLFQPGTFDLNQSNLFITPNGEGGVTVSPSAVPEPATWALMIGGFGLVGAAMRRRTLVAA